LYICAFVSLVVTNFLLYIWSDKIHVNFTFFLTFLGGTSDQMLNGNGQRHPYLTLYLNKKFVHPWRFFFISSNVNYINWIFNVTLPLVTELVLFDHKVCFFTYWFTLFCNNFFKHFVYILYFCCQSFCLWSIFFSFW
jgi:hypothetical protein